MLSGNGEPSKRKDPAFEDKKELGAPFNGNVISTRPLANITAFRAANSAGVQRGTARTYGHPDLILEPGTDMANTN